MKPEQWRRIERLFEGCLKLPPEARDNWLDVHCREDPEIRREVESLLAYERRQDRLEELVGRSRKEALGPPADSSRESAGHRPGELVGAYRLESCLGEGGMGSVWRGRRADDQFEQQVAIKFVKGMGLVHGWHERFRTERQILAQLQHPHISRLLDGGSTEDGQPYLVMELVEGEDLITYCDQRRLGLKKRLDLFLQVASGVEHAHRHLIVHRDLKPANILVHPEMGPKLLDFGIAKMLADEGVSEGRMPTLPQERLLTPAYASPEQVLGQPATTASDVYSLGVVLFELLTGQRPRRVRGLAPTDLARQIQEAEPTRPSTSVRRLVAKGREGTDETVARSRGGLEPAQLVRRLRGDLDTITLRALDADPTRRYRGVAELTADIERYLRGDPVLARPDTLAYRTGKWIGRHPWGAGAVALILSLLVALGAGLVLYSVRLGAERDRALAAESEARTVSEFLLELFAVADPSESRGETVTARELLERGGEMIETRLSDEPEVEAALLSTLADVHLNLGLRERAETLHRRALERRLEHFGPEHLETAGSHDRLGDTLRQLTRWEESEAELRRSLATREAQLAPSDPAVAESLNNLGLLLKEREEHESAEPLLRRALEVRLASLGHDHPDTDVSRSNLGQLLLETRRYEEASPLLELVVEGRLRRYGENHPKVALGLHALGTLRHEQGRLSEAEALLERTIHIRRVVLPPHHSHLADSLNNLAAVLHDQVRLEEAEGLYREALEIDRLGAGDLAIGYAYGLNNLGSLLDDLGRYEEAEPLYQQSLDLRREHFGPDSRSYQRMLSKMGRLALRAGDLTLAEERLREADEWLTAELEPDHPDRIRSMERLALLQRARGDFEGSASLLRAALDHASRAHDARHRIHAELQAELTWTLARSNGPTRCEAVAETARARPGFATADDLTRGRVELAAGLCLSTLGRRDEAGETLSTALGLLRPSLGDGNHWVRAATNELKALGR